MIVEIEEENMFRVNYFFLSGEVQWMHPQVDNVDDSLQGDYGGPP